MTFGEASRADGSVWTVPDGWQQGRGAFGGLTLAALARAAAAETDVAERPLRSVTAEIPGAVLAGAAGVEVAALRHGRGLSSLAAHVEQRGEIVAHAVASFGKPRAQDADRFDAPRPAPPAFADVPVVPDAALGPPFTRHFEFRIVRGVPLSGARDAACEGWVRLRAPGDVPRWAALLALVDAWFPSAAPTLTEWRPVGTISFAAHLFDAEWSPGEPLFHRSRLIGSQGGYFCEARELWTPRGALLVVNQQTVAWIK